MSADKNIKKRLNSLEQHLKEENPVLVSVVSSFRKLDRVGYSLGLLDKTESFAEQISWWPLISVLGTFSAGKSTFINHYLQRSLQSTGNQAVDDKFSVICYTSDSESRLLPGLALDADPRFPFYHISQEIEKVASGEGGRVDAYLQLKTCPCDHLRGRIIIDSPGFDADEQRSATLRLTDHIVGISDLVLVLFDARHPEPGAMADTLTHLVGATIGRADCTKFLYILNQIDTTAREDNPEEIVGAWQRALAQGGLKAGNFFTIYSPDAAVPIDDEALRKRFEEKRDHDLDEIHDRIEQVSVERSYRIIGELEKTARMIETKTVPQLQSLINRWARSVLWADAAILGTLTTLFVAGTVWAGYWQGLKFEPPWWSTLTNSPVWLWGSAGTLAAVVLFIHSRMRKSMAGRVRRHIIESTVQGPDQERMLRAFSKNTRFWRSIFEVNPAGWGRSSRKRVRDTLAEANLYVRNLNDRFTDPSGKQNPKDSKIRAVRVKETSIENDQHQADVGNAQEKKVG